MMVERRILEAIDACRPDSDDLDRPEFAETAELLKHDPHVKRTYENVQALDRKLCAAMDEAVEKTPVPTGLAARILENLERSAPPAQAQESTGSVPIAPLRRPRRYAIGAVLALAASLLVAVWIGFLRQPAETLTAENWRQIADRWYDEIAGDPMSAASEDEWRKLPPPRGFSASQQVVASPRRWQRWTSSSGVSAVAFDHTPPGSKDRVILFVVRAKVPRIGVEPLDNVRWTQGRSIGAWQEGERFYVLVVEGDEHRYRRYVDSHTGPLA